MAMRTFPDRIRHTILFEILGLAIVTPGAAYLYDQPVLQIGVVGVGSSLLATVWNFVFNLGFDHAMLRLMGHTAKTYVLRVVHVVLFELGLLIMILPAAAWYLNMSLLETLMLDMSLVAFYLVYNFLFNLAYDRVFPVPAATPKVYPAETAAIMYGQTP